MAVRTKIDPINRDIDLILKEDLGPVGRSAALATFAREQLAEALDTNRRVIGQTTRFETFVDGQRGAAIDAVKPDGVIVFEFELVSDLLGWIDQQLRTHSPVKKGEYRDSHLLLADGIEFDPAGPLPEAAEFVFLNVAPYARKIERGQSKQAATGVYQVVAELARRRFGNIARIKFSYRAFSQGSIVNISRVGPLQVKRRKNGQFVAGSHTRAGNKRERSLRQPAIIVTL